MLKFWKGVFTSSAENLIGNYLYLSFMQTDFLWKYTLKDGILLVSAFIF